MALVARGPQLDLPSLSRLAAEFDELSVEDGEYWPAQEFVTWLTFGQSAQDLAQREVIEARLERLHEGRVARRER